MITTTYYYYYYYWFKVILILIIIHSCGCIISFACLVWLDRVCRGSPCILCPIRQDIPIVPIGSLRIQGGSYCQNNGGSMVASRGTAEGCQIRNTFITKDSTISFISCVLRRTFSNGFQDLQIFFSFILKIRFHNTQCCQPWHANVTYSCIRSFSSL